MKVIFLFALTCYSFAALACGEAMEKNVSLNSLLGRWVQTVWPVIEDEKGTIETDLRATLPLGPTGQTEIIVKAPLQMIKRYYSQINISELRENANEPKGGAYQIKNEDGMHRFETLIKNKLCGAQVTAEVRYFIDGEDKVLGGSALEQLIRNSPNGQAVFSPQDSQISQVTVKRIEVPYFANADDSYSMCPSYKGKLIIDCN